MTSTERKLVLSRCILLTTVSVGAIALTVAAAVPADALTAVQVTAGSAITGTDVPFRAVSGTQSWKDLATNATYSCTSSTLSGSTRVGGNAPAGFAGINGSKKSAGNPNGVYFNSCTVIGLPRAQDGVGTSQNSSNTWTISATGATVSGVTPIVISNINIAVAHTSCSYSMTGSVAATFTNGNPATISIPATTAATSRLVVSSVALKSGATSCIGGMVNKTPGDKISVSGTYNVDATNTTYNPIAVKAS